ncbi:MAG: GIY-YIG nuclease family protein [Bacteroidales bacterium]|nr:GIY-YIG nuclease family protein [Bacteroidales bacterium]MBK6964001.1 GIY-YIG nuclease family protein [Bacteroidales bacterium]MBK6964002.1 GIY-YIG nuclease family protein [Bacteroidales bacterium]
MPFTYILYSVILDRYYIGSTRDTVMERVYKHNNQHKGFTSAASDWQLVYEEFYQDYSMALLREKTIKKWKSRKLVERLIKQT